MRRRPLLAALTGALAPALAGCSTFDGDRVPTVTPAAVPEDPVVDASGAVSRPATAPGQPIRWASLVAFDTAGLRASLYPTQSRTAHGVFIAWFVAPATADGPARVAVRFVNTTSRTRRYRFAAPAPLGAPTLRSATGTLRLVPTTDHPAVADGLVGKAPALERGSGGCWRLVDRFDDRRGTDEYSLAPESSVGGEYVVVADPDGGCPAPDTYAAEDGLRLSLALWDPDRPGPTRESRFAGVSMPALPDVPATDWYHEADRSTPLYLEPSAEHVDLPATVTFTLVNRSRLPLGGNPDAWGLWKLSGGTWRRIAPATVPDRTRWVPTGAREHWSLRLRDGSPIDSMAIDVGHLDGGRYAFVVPYGRATRQTGALLDVDVPALTARPDTADEPEPAN